MQFGDATLASNTTSIPEVAGDAAILLAPEDTEGWAQAMLRLAANRMERDRLRDAAKMQAARFSWEDSANQLLKLYEVAVASPKRFELGQARCRSETNMNITKEVSGN